jgi:hypothetical protein
MDIFHAPALFLLVAAVIGYVLPLVSARVAKAHWPPEVEGLLTLVFATSGGLVPLDTFGSAWACQMRTSPDAALAAEFTVDSSNAAAGWIVLNSLPGTVTAALKADETYGADVEATGGTLSPFTVWSLTFYVKGDYTR